MRAHNGITPRTSDTKQFYNDLVSGKIKRGWWGKSSRFDAESINKKKSVKKYFEGVIGSHLSSNYKVLDLGCGSGGFTLASAGFCKEIIGVDISEKFVEEGQETIKRLNVGNASIMLIKNNKLPFEDSSFDAVIMVDVLHHLDDIHQVIEETLRTLKTGGKIIIFEPNKYNPLLYLMCMFDKNERGLLRLGSISKYRALLNRQTSIESIFYNGLLIGPQNRMFLLFIDFINQGVIKYFLSWLNPKIAIIAKK